MGEKKYIEMFCSFTEPFIYKNNTILHTSTTNHCIQYTGAISNEHWCNTKI